MDTDELIPFVAISIGLSHMIYHFKKVQEMDDLSYYSIEYTLSGILASVLWIMYQYKKGANYSVAYSGLGLFFSLYLFKRVLKDRADKSEKYYVHSHGTDTVSTSGKSASSQTSSSQTFTIG